MVEKKIMVNTKPNREKCYLDCTQWILAPASIFYFDNIYVISMLKLNQRGDQTSTFI